MKTDIRQNKQTPKSVPSVWIEYPWLFKRKEMKEKLKV